MEIALTPGDEMPKDKAASFFVAQRIVLPRQSIARYDFANPDRLGRSVYVLLQQVHERFPMTLNQLLLMRVRMGIHLSSLRLEKDSCAHFLRRDYSWSVAAAFQVIGRGVWLLSLSRSTALRLMDRWLGGPGQSVERPPETWTPLEQAILRGLLTTFAEAYAMAWAQLGEQMELRLTQLFVGDWTEQAVTLLSESSGALLLSHRLQVGEEAGVVQWLLPAETLLGFSERQRRTATTPSATPHSRHVNLSLRCGWRGEPIPLRRLPQLQVGDILLLQAPLLIWHNDRPIAIGKPFRKGNRIVVQVTAHRHRKGGEKKGI